MSTRWPRRSAPSTEGWRGGGGAVQLTFDFERTPPVESIQMYLWNTLEIEAGE